MDAGLKERIEWFIRDMEFFNKKFCDTGQKYEMGLTCYILELFDGLDLSD